MSYYPPPPGVGGAQNSLPPRPQLDFRPPPPSGPGGGRRGGGGDRGGYSGGRSRQARGGRDNSYGSNSAPGGSRNNHHQSFAPPPRSDFTFRADKPVGVQEAQQRGGNDGGDHYAPRDGPRRDRFRGRQGVERGGRDSDRRRGGDRRRDYNNSYNNNSYNSSSYNGNGGYGRRGRGGNFSSLRFLAANRPILTQTQTGDGNGGVFQDFVGKGNEGTTYLNLDDLSDSDEAEMDISGDEDGNAEGEDASENDDGDAPPRKRARRSEKSSAKEEPLAPKWSNPDPYTVLPPTEGQGGVKKKDVVQLIRKARVKAERAAAETSADTEEFISCGMDSSDDDGDEIKLLDDDEDNEDELKFNDDDDDDDDEEDGEVQSGDDDLGRVNLIGRNGKLGGPELSAASLSHNTTHAPASSSSAPPDAPRGPRGSKQQQAAPSSLAADLNTSRKRTHDDELKPLLLPNHAILKRVNKMPVGGYIVPGWQPKASEPPCPWISEQDDASSGELTSHMGVWLHKEITDFYEFVRPQDFEEALRQALLDDLDASVRKRFPNGRINCFGSFMSGLYLPTGDMDIVMCSTQFLGNRPPVFSKKGHLFKFGSFLCQNRLAEREHLEHITKAKVPLVKYIDLKTGLKVDVSFENMNGVVANKTFADWKKQFPEMPILVTMIKQFLAMRGLNEPVNGGIGGFSVICLVVSMLQMMPPMQSKDMVGQNHLGDLLMHFFDLYGNKFNYEATAISLNPPGYIPKSKVRNFTYKNPDRLSIIDPNNEDNDISGGSKNTPAIMREFAEAYDALQKRMVDLAKLPLDQRAHQSILGVILQGDYSTYRHQRDYLREVYVREFKREPRAY